jgi:pimeloyl-ACP methyl ester carboxylesterase
MTTVIRKKASGRPDLTAEVSDAVARGAQTYPLHAERHTYVGAGHIPHITHPSEFAADVTDYAAR